MTDVFAALRAYVDEEPPKAKTRKHEPMAWEVMEQEELVKHIGHRRANRYRNQPVLVAKTQPGHAYKRFTKEHA